MTTRKITDFLKANPKKQKINVNNENCSSEASTTTSIVDQDQKEDAIGIKEDDYPSTSSLDKDVSMLVGLGSDSDEAKNGGATFIERSSRAHFLTYLLDQETKHDCYFTVGKQEFAETWYLCMQKKIGVVKKMLMAHSSVLRAQLDWEESRLAEKEVVRVEVDDLYPDTFITLLKYVYGHDTTASLTFDEADDLLYAAEKYMMEPFKARLSSRLITLLTPDNICQLLNNPACYRLLELQSTITEILQCETARVLESPAFLRLNVDGFMKILEQEAMNVEEIQVWRAAVKWGTHRGGTEEGTVLREQLSEPLKQIRVCTISLENFHQEVVPTRILNDTSVTMVCLYHGKKEKQAELVQVSNETKPRVMKTPTKSLETVYVKMPLPHNCNWRDSCVLLLTKRFGVELLPLEFTANFPRMFFPGGLTYECDCTVEITEITDYVNNTSTKPPLTVRFCQQVEYRSVFQVPLTSNGENIRLCPNTKYKLSVEFTEDHTMYGCIQRTTAPLVRNEHLALEFTGFGHIIYISPVKGLRYKPIQYD